MLLLAPRRTLSKFGKGKVVPFRIETHCDECGGIGVGDGDGGERADEGVDGISVLERSAGDGGISIPEPVTARVDGGRGWVGRSCSRMFHTNLLIISARLHSPSAVWLNLRRTQVETSP